MVSQWLSRSCPRRIPTCSRSLWVDGGQSCFTAYTRSAHCVGCISFVNCFTIASFLVMKQFEIRSVHKRNENRTESAHPINDTRIFATDAIDHHADGVAHLLQHKLHHRVHEISTIIISLATLFLGFMFAKWLQVLWTEFVWVAVILFFDSPVKELLVFGWNCIFSSVKRIRSSLVGVSIVAPNTSSKED